MNYTKNYHLPQWDETDRIMRTDFNQMCAGLEDGLTTAQAAANAAQQTADAAAVLPYVIGTYTGTGADLSIDVGFRPRFLIISGIKEVDPKAFVNVINTQQISGRFYQRPYE